MSWIDDPPQVIKDLVRKTPNTIEYDQTYPDPEVVIPVIRRVMPTLIAYDIIGVAPMVGPNPLFYKAFKEIKTGPSGWVNNDHLYYPWEDPIV